MMLTYWMKMSKIQAKRGLSLLELMITMTIVSILGLAIISSMVFAIYARQMVQEQNGAMRAAADIMESTRRTLFNNLQDKDLADILIDDRGTPELEDDLLGTAELNFFDRNGNAIGLGGTVPMDRTMLRAEVVVRWNPIGRQTGEQKEVILTSYLSP